MSFKHNMRFQTGFAYANRFKAIISGFVIPPEQLETISFPGKAINTFEYPINGWRHQGKMPGGYFFEDISLTIRETDYSIYQGFVDWQAKVIDPERYVLNWPKDFERDGQIFQLDKKGNTIKQAHLEGLYPTGINNIEFGSSSENTITTMTVTLAYTNMKIL
jgi:hypothetical protein